MTKTKTEGRGSESSRTQDSFVHDASTAERGFPTRHRGPVQLLGGKAMTDGDDGLPPVVGDDDVSEGDVLPLATAVSAVFSL
jgi:hypothetical protein